MLVRIAQQRIRHYFLRRRGIVVNPTAIIKGQCNIHGSVSIGESTIVQSSSLDGRGSLRIGACVILDQCTILTAQHDIDEPVYPATYAPVEIGDYVIIYQGSLVLPGRKIGRGAVIAAHSVVSKDVPPMAMVAGNPGRVIRIRRQVHKKCNMKAMGGLNFLQKLLSENL